MSDDPKLRVGALEVYVNEDGSLYFHADGDLCETVLSETPTREEATALRDLLNQFIASRPRAPT